MERDNKVSLGEFISGRRKHMRFTQENLADAINVSKSAIAKWETNRGIPDRDNMQRLSEVLGVSVNDLYRLSGSRISTSKMEINITRDVIETLESYGYIVIAPDNSNEE